ncbi:VOC family protein [Microbulbifer sp. 2205BS26-8]|uniref:VOC family protein n=1 Tax=Microbulbifer sp. 2205BS26-8 TaxID=3064386 RepID=UPI00273D42B7|nr:VOC family protein [Microbulbifer sp. 2205BS26-8]MDP5209583.1 VOC family protein [Microbulbifer sp. 2205BS26-8]
MFTIQQIDHLVLRVKSLDIARRFYQDILGCKMERENPSLGLYQMRTGRCLIDLLPVDQQIERTGASTPEYEGRNLHHFCLRVDPFNADKIQSFLQERHISASPVEQRYGAEGMGPSLYISDPENNLIELKGPPDG